MMNPPIIIAGSGRSGTTWILDSIAEANNLHTIFEPLNPVLVPAAKPFAYRYVRDDSHEPALRNFMDRVFAGNLRSIWANYRLNPHMLRPWSTLARGVFRRYRHNPLLQFKVLCGQYVRLLSHYRKYKRPKSDHLIVKFIRANLMIGWLAKNYDTKIVLVVKHSAAVISSRLRFIESSPAYYWGFD